MKCTQRTWEASRPSAPRHHDDDDDEHVPFAPDGFCQFVERHDNNVLRSELSAHVQKNLVEADPPFAFSQ